MVEKIRRCPECEIELLELGETNLAMRLFGCPKCGHVFWTTKESGIKSKPIKIRIRPRESKGIDFPCKGPPGGSLEHLPKRM